MTVAENRYLLEHRWLPHWFFEQKEALVSALLDGDSHYLYEVMRRACEDEQESLPYHPSDYRSEMIKLTPTLYCVRIHMPQPEHIPHCYRIYLLFSTDFSKKAYFTIERGLDEDYLCCWNEEGLHVNYGVAPQDLAEELAQVSNRFSASQ